MTTAALDISVMIVAYNSQGFIAECLNALPRAATDVSYEVLLIDNGDGETERLVAQAFPQVQIVASQGNVGFAKGNNLLAAHARGDKLLLLNPDMRLNEGAIEALFQGSIDHSGASAWGAVTLDCDGLPDSGNAIAIPSLREFFSLVLGRSNIGNRTKNQLVQDEEVLTLSGSCFLIDKAAWQEAGGLDERYFLYCEEVDLFHRLRQKGHSFWRIGKARGVHNSGHGEAASAQRMLFRLAGTVQFMRLHWSAPARILGTALLWVAAIERHAAGEVLGRWRPHLRRMGEAYRLIARRPDLWMAGYDTDKGLLPRLNREEGLR